MSSISLIFLLSTAAVAAVAVTAPAVVESNAHDARGGECMRMLQSYVCYRRGGESQLLASRDDPQPPNPLSLSLSRFVCVCLSLSLCLSYT